VTPEFSRPERIDTIGERDRTVEVAATEAERAALARRFDLVALDRLEASWTIRREPGSIAARGRVRATLAQACSVTGDPVPATVDEQAHLRFVPEGDASEEELELDSDAADTIFYAGAAIDLGEAAAETMALALDPFPRAPDAEETLREAGVRGDDEPDAGGAFGALAALRDKLGK
jgi:uncharacterized metal-binding protein YceD (DUF177 family)